MEPSPESTGRKQDGTFAPGVSGNPAGRPKGSRHKLSEDFFKALADDFEKHGVTAIVKMRDERPGDYAKMVAGLMTKEVEHSGDIGLGGALDALPDN
jgi:hypothetical protein